MAVFCGWLYECKPQNCALFWISKPFIEVIKQFLYGPVHDAMRFLCLCVCVCVFLLSKMKSLIVDHHPHHHHLHRHLHHHGEESGCEVTSLVLPMWIGSWSPSVQNRVGRPTSSHVTLLNGMPHVEDGLLTYFSGDFVNFVFKSKHLFSYVCNFQYVGHVRIS